MMVTAVERLDKKRSRVLFDQDLALVLYPQDLRQFSLAEGSELSEEAYERLLGQVLKPRARERLLKTLMISDKTERELIDLLHREGYPQEVVEDAVGMVKKHHYIDDEAYGSRYVQPQGKKKSRSQLIFAMQKKGFSRELIDELLEEHPVNEEEQMEKYLAQKGIDTGENLSREEYRKLAAKLARKGYSYEAISRVLRGPSLF